MHLWNSANKGTIKNACIVSLIKSNHFTLRVQKDTRPERCYLSGFLRCPQSAYVRYASIVRLENHTNSIVQGRRVEKESIFVSARRLIDAYRTYAEWKQRGRNKNWLFFNRVSFYTLRVYARQFQTRLLPACLQLDLSWQSYRKTE